MVRKLFTPKEANRSLPLVRSIVTDILDRARELRGQQDPPRSEGEETAREEIQQDILGMMEELENLGASFKDWDFDVGLVDFPSRIDGEDVLLCWRSDEDRVAWFHTPDGGFASRQPIPAQLLPEDEN
ncbi:MAG: hypothetical protein DHS20C21_10910 [Gemmatimonadota bacterium]|nr:MAG: hypothetical protein DHS20C21_10910 [Gemmatimonadota bacterium]